MNFCQLLIFALLLQLINVNAYSNTFELPEELAHLLSEEVANNINPNLFTYPEAVEELKYMRELLTKIVSSETIENEEEIIEDFEGAHYQESKFVENKVVEAVDALGFTNQQPNHCHQILGIIY
jgi:hypothetical protein